MIANVIYQIMYLTVVFLLTAPFRGARISTWPDKPRGLIRLGYSSKLTFGFREMVDIQ